MSKPWEQDWSTDADNGLKTHDGYPARKNADGSHSTEVSVTVTNPRLNGGKPTNIPSLWGGVELDEDSAVESALKSGRQFQSFDSIDAAVAAAKTRSNTGGAGADKKPWEQGFQAADGSGKPGKKKSFVDDIAEFGLDMGKRAAGAVVSGVASIPLGIEKSAKALVRQSVEASGDSMMPAGIYNPGIDTDESIHGRETSRDKDARFLAGERAASGIPNLPGARSLAQAGQAGREAIHATTSDATQRAVADSQVTGNLFKGEIDFGNDPSVRGYVMQASDVFGSMLPVIAGSLITRSPGVGGAIGGSMAAGEGAESATKFITEKTNDELMQQSPFFARLVNGGASPDEARRLTVDKASESAALLQGAVASVGDRFTGKLVTGKLDPLLTRAAGKSIVGKTAAGLALSGAEEGVQEVAEGVAADIGMASVVPSKEIGEGSAANFVLGAMGGGPAGGARGAYTGIRDRIAGGQGVEDQNAGGTPGETPPGQGTPPAGAAGAGQPTAGVPNPGRTAAPAQAAGVASNNTDEAERALRTPVNLTALDRADELGGELARIDQRLAELAPENGYGPSFDTERAELQQQADAARTERETIASTWPTTIKGTPTQFSTEAGVKLDGEYALVDADSLVTSHDENLRTNPLFPAELQPRDRSRQASEMQVSGIVQKLDPARLGVSADSATGAPIIGADGLVESGNARTIALKRVYQANGQKAEDYKAWLKQSAAQFGITPESVDGLRKPVLVRVRNTPVNRAEFARQANQSTIQRMSPSEQAATDAKRLTSLEGLNPDDNGEFSTSYDFIRQFMAGLPITEQSDMIESDGRLSTTGYRRMQNAVLAKAYGDSPTLRRMTESMDGGLANVGKALTRAAPTIARARERIDAGSLFEADIAPDLLAAVEGLNAVKDKGWTVQQELAQTDLTGPKYSPEATELLQFLADNVRSPRRIAEFLQRYYEALEAAGDPNQGSLLGDTVAPARADLLKAAGGKKTVRVYHGGIDAGQDGPLWFSRDLKYAQGYAQKTDGGQVFYVDLPADHPAIARDDEFGVEPPTNFELPAEIASKRKPLETGDTTDGQDAQGPAGQDRKEPQDAPGNRQGAQGNEAQEADAGAGQPRADEGQGAVEPEPAPVKKPPRTADRDFWSYAKEQGHAPKDVPIGSELHTRLKAEFEALKAGKARLKAITGKKLDGDWAAFSKASGALGVPRADMPQIKAAHRGALTQFLAARDVTHQADADLDAASLRPTQAEFSTAKVKKAQDFEGGERSILISADSYVLDGHHQWLASLAQGLPIRAIRFDAPMAELLPLAREFPSADVAQGAETAPESAAVEASPAADLNTLRSEALPIARTGAFAKQGLTFEDRGGKSAIMFKGQEIATLDGARSRQNIVKAIRAAKAEAQVLTQPTEADVVARQDLAAQSGRRDAREQVKRESEAGAGQFELDREEGRQDTTGDIFAQQDAPEKSEAFKKWFGDSKVVDADGNPMVMYHGTNKTEQGEAFTMFDAYASNYGLFGQGAYFTDDASVASEYTSKGKGSSPTVYAAYMSIKNPIDMDADADPEAWSDAYPDLDLDAYHEGGTSNESYYRAAEEALRDEGMEKWEGAEAMQSGLRKMGHDGITHVGGGRVKSEGKKHRVFIAFDPEQIKSATGNRGSFDPDSPDIRLSRSDSPRNLVAMHNLTAENLLYADSMGGIPVPSIGITKVETPFKGFGEVTLIAPSTMVDPEQGTPVFDRDAWTARFPKMNFKKVKAKVADAFYERMKPARQMGDDGDSFTSLLWEQLRNASVQSPDKIADLFRRYNAAKMFYAKEVLGKDIKVPMKPAPLSSPAANDKQLQAYWKKNGQRLVEIDRELSGFEFSNSPEYKAFIVEVEAAVRRYADSSGRPDRADSYVSMFLPDGALGPGGFRDLKNDFEKVGTKVVDGIKFNELIRKAVPDNDPAYQRWVSSLVEPLFEAPTITVRGKEVEPTLDNIVESMTIGATQGAEKSLTFGPGKTAAMLGKRFKSMADIKADRERVVSQSQEGEAKKAIEAILEEYRTLAAEFFTQKDWRGNIDTWAANDASMEALAKAGKSGGSDADIRQAMTRAGFRGVNEKTIALARQSIAALRNAATDYFEAKPQRAVKLSEFRAAVVPKGVSQEVKDTLAKNGIEFIEFNKNAEGAREAAIQKMAKRMDKEDGEILFSRAADPLAILSETDDLFSLPKSNADTIEQIAAENDPEIKVRKASLPGNETMYTLTMADGTRAMITVRQSGPNSVYGAEVDADNNTTWDTGRPGENPEAVPEGTEDVWIDVSNLKPGQNGARVYNIAANFAHNTDRIFIGDPAGLSDEAMRRRAEHMLSSALKFGTTKHLAPHPRQTDGATGLGVPALKWVYGDDIGNIERLIELNVKALDSAYPEAAQLTYDPQSGTFSADDKKRLDPAGVKDLFSGGPIADRRGAGRRAAFAGAGWRTLARGAVFRALLRGRGAQGDGAGRAGAGEGILDQLVRQRAQLASSTQDERVLYSRNLNGEAGDLPGRITFKDLQAIAERARKSAPNMPTVHVLADPSKAPLKLREYIIRQDAWLDVEGAMHGGELYLFASGLVDAARAEHVLLEHEAAHYGLRAILGGSLKTAMRLVYIQNASVRKAVTELQKRGKLSDIVATEEVIVDIPSADLARLKGWRQVVGKVRDWLASRGYTALADRITGWLDGTMTQQERADLFVADLVRAARDHVKGKRPGRAAVFGTRLSGTLAEDIAKQEAWLQREAKARGFKDIEDLLERDYPTFEKLAELWRKKNPEDALLSRTPAKAEAVAASDAVMLKKAAEEGATERRSADAGSDAGNEIADARALMGPNGRKPNGRGPDFKEAAREILGDPERKTEILHSVIYRLQDRLIDLKWLQGKIAESGGTVSDLNDAYRGEELYHRRAAALQDEFLADELRPLLARMNRAGIGLEQFEAYLHARHAPEANRVLATRNLTAEELDAKRTELAERVASLEQAAQRAKASDFYSRTIEEELVDARAERDVWRRAQPFAGTAEERAMLSGMSDAQAAAIMAAVPPAKRATYEALAAQVDGINNKTREMLVASGLTSRAESESWANLYKHYVPLHRDEEHPDSRVSMGQGFSVKGREAKARTGSSKAKVTNILAHVATQREAAITRSEKNAVAKKVWLLAAQNPMPGFWSLEAPKISHVDNATGQVMRGPDPTYMNRPNVLAVKTGGKTHAVVFDERNERAMRLAAELKGLDAQELDWVTQQAGKVTRWLSAVNTQYNPVFGVINFMRDVQAAALQLSTTPLRGQERQVLRGSVPALRAIWAAEREQTRAKREGRASRKPADDWGKLWQEMNEAGGMTGYRDAFQNIEERGKALDAMVAEGERTGVKRGFFEMVDLLSDYNTAMEGAIRLAAYKMAKERGMNFADAASIAKNLTVNFNRKGAWARRVGPWYAFFNAAVQGTTRMVETLSGPAGRKIVLGGMGLGFTMGVVASAMLGGDGDDEDEQTPYQKIPDFVKERALIVPLGGQDYIAIPMPLGYNMLTNAGRLLAEQMMGSGKPERGNAKTAIEGLGMAMSAFNPLGGADAVQMVTPSPVDWAVDLLRNKDWTGRDIAMTDRSNLDPTPGHSRGKDSATPWANALSRGVNWMTGGTEFQPGAWSPTPDQIDYVIGQITGGVGREAGKLASTLAAPFTGEDLPANKIPLVGRLYGNTRSPSAGSELFYENVRQANLLENEIRGRLEARESTDDLEPYAYELMRLGKGADARVRGLRRRKRFVMERAADGHEEDVKRLNEEIGRVMDDFNRDANRARRVAAE